MSERLAILGLAALLAACPGDDGAGREGAEAPTTAPQAASAQAGGDRSAGGGDAAPPANAPVDPSHLHRGQAPVESPRGAPPSGVGQPATGAGGLGAHGELPILPPEVQKRIDEGLAKVKAEDLDGALEVFTALIADHPEVFDAYDHRSMIFYNRQEYEKVAADCSKAMELARANGTFELTCPERCLTRRGASYLNLEQWEPALVDFNEVLKYKPLDGFTWFEQGRALHGLGRDVEARAAFNKALELAPDHPVVKEIAPYLIHKIDDPDFH